MNKTLFFLLASALILTPTSEAAKIQRQGIKTAAECIASGSTAANCLPLDAQVWDSTNAQQLSVSIASGQLGGGGGGASGVELLKNPAFESGAITNGWTTTGGTSVLVTSGANVLYGKATASFQATAIGQKFQSTPVPVQGLSGGGCSAQIYYAYAGTSGDYTFQVTDGTNALGGLILNANTNTSTPLTVYFPCGSAPTSTLQWQLVSNVTTPGFIYFDNTHLGSNGTYQASQASVVGTASWLGTSACNWTTTSASFGDFVPVAACPAPVVDGLLSAPATKVPHVVESNAPAGTYVVSFEGSVGGGVQGTSSCAYRIVDETGVQSSQVDNSASGGQSTFHASARFIYSNSGTHTWKVQSSTAGGISCSITNDPSSTSIFRVEYFPGPAQMLQRVDTAAASWSGYIPSHGGGWTTATSGFTDPDSYNNLSVPALVETENVNFGTVTSFGVRPGITFNPPKVGKYFVCASAVMNAPSADVIVAQLIDESGHFIDGADSYYGLPVPMKLCGTINAASLSPKTIKIQIRNSNNSSLASLGNGSSSASALFTIFQLDAAQPAPVFPNQNPRSEVWIQGQGGVGSTNTATIYYANVVKNVGTAITYNHSTSLGDSWTINEPGIYGITFMDMSLSSALEFGLTLDSTQLTTGPSGMTPANVIAYVSSQVSQSPVMGSVAGINLVPGQVIRAQTGPGYTLSSGGTKSGVRVTKLSN